MNSRLLYAGPWPGEFGVFLGWQACARWKAWHLRQAGKINRVVMCGRPGWEPLVSDFVDEYIHVDFPGVPIGSFAHGGWRAEDIAKMVPKGAIHFPAFHSRSWGNDFEEKKGDKHSAHQLFIRYGIPRLAVEYDRQILLHARCRQDWGVKRNWPQDRWDALASMLAHHGKLVSIGSPSGAMLVEGTEDARGESLADLCDRMRFALCVVGPSSGPMHLAALCGTPHVVWFGGDDGSPQAEKDALKIATLWERYTTAWNPFRTPVCPIVARDWQPEASTVLDFTAQMLGGTYVLPPPPKPPQPTPPPPKPPQTVKSEIITRHGKPLNGTRPPTQALVCVLVYKRHDLAKTCIDSICRRFGGVPAEVAVFDNSEDGGVFGAWLAERVPSAHYFQASKNLGCTVPRNVIARFCQQRGIPYFAFVDQDVEITRAGWLRDMLKPFQEYPDTGLVAWPLSNSRAVFGGESGKTVHAVDGTGSVLEFPGLCVLHSTAKVVACPYEERIFMWGFDTLQCLRFRKRGWPSRLVALAGGTDKIAHRSPHSGVNMNPEKETHRARSRVLLREIVTAEALEDVPGVCEKVLDIPVPIVHTPVGAEETAMPVPLPIPHSTTQQHHNRRGAP